MEYTNHVILGAGGAISRSLIPELLRYNQNVVAVSRSGHETAGTQSVAADLLDYNALRDAVPEGSAVYLLAGLPYDARVWSEQWPTIMSNTIQACEETGSLLVFFDNVYMYGDVDGAMTEQTPHQPVSKKGAIRAEVVEQLQDAYAGGRINAVVARSADFYGPGADKNGIPNLLVFDRLNRGKTAQWPANADVPHSFTYTSDCGRALPMLVWDETAHNRVWHLPTANPPITGRRFVEIAAEQFDQPGKVSLLKPWMLRTVGLFDRTVKELVEMNYQNTSDYIFDSSAFEEHFAFTPTSYEQGIAETANYYQHSS